MRRHVIGFAFASLVLGCGDDGRTGRLPPETVIDDKPAALTNQRHAVIAFHGAGDPDHFTCALDGAAEASCTSPYEADVADGDHTFLVRAAIGTTVDDSPADYHWTVDTVAPDTAITAAPPVLDNAAAPQLVFAGTDDRGAVTLECALDDAAFAACTSPATLSALADGSHTYRVRAIDGAGNVDPTPASATWTLDSRAPDTMIASGPAAGAFTQAAVSFEFGSPDSPVTFECALDAAAFAACSSPQAYTALAEGAHTFAVRALDPAGLADPSPATRAWTVDTTAPAVAITSGPTTLTNDSTPAFGFTVTGATTIECRVDGGGFAACASPFTTAALADGSHTFTVRGTDAAGNTAAQSRTFTVDTVPPTVTVTPVASPTSDRTPTVTFVVAGGATTVTCQVDGGAFAACASPLTTGSLADGDHTVTVHASDPAGNTGTGSTTFTVDATPPVVAVTPVASPTSDSTPAVSFTVTGATAIACRVDGGAFVACTSPFTPAALADGSHTITVRGTDAANNAATGATTFTVDTVAPIVNVTDVASPTRDNTPSVAFTATGATAIQCQIDGGGFAACSSPFTTPALVDGSHTVTVRATDAAGNAGSDATTFTVDATPPGVAIDDAPPALWPVNYFDFKFHTTDPTASLSCSLNGAAFTACASPLTITTGYNVASSFAVRATDAAGNVATTAPASWTAQNGLVLHYPWEQGQTLNTSLLAQKPAYSPDGTVSLVPIGGWAGTAANSPAAHTYKSTIRPLSSSANGQYTASLWVRIAQGSNGGLLFSNLAANDGLSLTLVGRQVQLAVHDNGQSFTTSAVVPPGQWAQIAVIATGPTKGVQLLINGNVVGTAAAPSATGFGPGQAADLTVGTVFDVDVDDLRFYNRALGTAERCTLLVRGQIGATGACVPLAPGMELGFERHQIVDTGTWNLPIEIPTVVSFLASNLGDRLRVDRNDQVFGYTQGFAPNVNASPGHSFSFWFVAGAFSDVLFDFLQPCSPVAVATCGIRVQYVANNGLVVVANGGATNPFAIGIPLAPGLHSVVVTEQKADPNGTTAQLSIYVDGALTTLPIGTVNVYAQPSDTVTLPHNVNGTQVDEYQFWPRDLSADPEMLCENGWDGEWNPATATCLLTSN